MILLTTSEILKVVFINVIVFLMMSTKILIISSTQNSLEINLFRNKVYDIMIKVHDLINKFLSPDSSYIVFGKYNNSVKEVIISLT